MWHRCEFESAAKDLVSSVREYHAEPDASGLLAAQRAFRNAMQVWSKLELFQFGPLSSRSESAGKDAYQGQGIRDLIYSWPAVARCRVEEQLATQNFTSQGVGNALVSARGLFGIEYSLFYSATDTACLPASSAATAWASLSEAELGQRKRDYALAVAEDVLEQARVLGTAWSPEGGDFRSVFVSASGYPSEQEALNVLGFALIYVEREVKDWKLGIPAGYTLTHPVTLAETPFALHGTENIRANLIGFRSLFEGCGPAGEGLGFDDWLNEAGHADLAHDLLVALHAAQVVADASPPLNEATPAEIETLYAAIKALTNLLKADLFGAGSPLGLKLPAGVEGDTD
jgi:predicted lipoprotein